MKLDIISENLRGLNEKVGLVFFGRAGELPDAIAEIESRCPKCGGELIYHTYENSIDEFGGVESIVEAEFCSNCGYYKKYYNED